MQFREIVSVTGLTGLYQLMSSKTNGAIVKNIGDNSMKFIPARLHQVTPLESIEIFTTGPNVYLYEVLDKMHEQDETPRPGAKSSSDEFKSYFRAVFPDLDEDRVYVSDMKKMLRWYELLKAGNLLDFTIQKQGSTGATDDGVAANPETPEAEAQIEEAVKDDQVAAVPLIEIPTKKAKAKKPDGPEDMAEETAENKKTARKKADPAQEESGKNTDPVKKATAKKNTEG